MNRRLALHKSRMGSSSGAGTTAAHQAAQRESSGRARQATAARVAARYAKAPSYSEMLAEEARAAVRAAEAASLAALQAQAAAESILAGLEAGLQADRQHEPAAAAAANRFWEPEVFHNVSSEPFLVLGQTPGVEPAVEASSLSSQTASGNSFGISWVTDMPVLSREPTANFASHGTSATQMAPEEGWEPQVWPPQLTGSEDREAREEAMEISQPLPANLIEFPRELIAARRIRPRLIEGPYAERDERQLSIFEVDPGTISTVPEMASDTAAEAATWQGARWSGMELEEEPAAKSIEKHREEAANAATTLHLAPFGLRAMAAMVDGTLILGAFLGIALAVATQMKHLPAKQEIELGSAAALLILGGFYQILFFTLAQSTPGMKYAHISLCTFDDENPTRAQLRSRMVALLLSLLPLGLGVLWAIFDEDHLSWHDRLSGTYQRQG